MEKITGHQSVRGRGGVIAVMYETHWKGLLRPSWEREMDLQHSRKQILLYWAGTPDQHRQTCLASKVSGSRRLGTNMFPAMFGPAVFATPCCLLAHTSGTRLKMLAGG